MFLNLLFMTRARQSTSGTQQRRSYSQPGGRYHNTQPRLRDRVARRWSPVLLMHITPVSKFLSTANQHLVPAILPLEKLLVAEKDRRAAVLSVSHSCLWTAAQRTELLLNRQLKLST